MKSEVTHKETAARQKYPCLMMAPITGNVWLMSAPQCGTLVYVGARATGYIGMQRNELAEEIFKPFNGTVTLSND